MKRKIIKIDHDLCNGCGDCIPNCPEGALQIIDGKAHLISDLFCDGLGACIGTCPIKAINIEEREARPYDERKVMENVIRHGDNIIKAHLQHLKEHGEHSYLKEALTYLNEKGIKAPCLEDKTHPQGCPGALMRDLSKPSDNTLSSENVSSQLRTWPVQLHLLNPQAPYLKEADLLISADCTAYTYGNFHQRFLKGRVPIILCPKLDQNIDSYIDKLTHVFKTGDINSLTVAKMEVPCCVGILQIIEEALRRAGKPIPIKEYTISIKGDLI